MSNLKDLVPPLDLCKEARELIGGKTALVWWYIGNEWVVADRKLSINDNAKYIIPAPTLAELLEMINKTSGTHPTVEAHEHDTWRVRAFTPGMPRWECDANPATAALWLLMRVKSAQEALKDNGNAPKGGA